MLAGAEPITVNDDGESAKTAHLNIQIIMLYDGNIIVFY